MMVVSEEKGGIFFPCFHGAQAATAMNRPMLTVTINGKAQQFAAGLTVLQALRQCGEDVATLCHDERMKPAATCRLCLVHIAGHNKPVTACNTPLADGMVIRTGTPDLEDERRTLLSWLAQHYPHDVPREFPSGRSATVAALRRRGTRPGGCRAGRCLAYLSARRHAALCHVLSLCADLCRTARSERVRTPWVMAIRVTSCRAWRRR